MEEAALLALPSSDVYFPRGMARMRREDSHGSGTVSPDDGSISVASTMQRPTRPISQSH